MTTTELFQGLGDGEKSSSRVLRPPGGGSSNIFGSDDPTPAAPTRQAASKPVNTDDNPYERRLAEKQTYVERQKHGDSKSNIFGVQTEGIQPAPQRAQPPPVQREEPAAQKMEDQASGDKETEKPTQSYKPREGCNPITGEAYGAKKDVHTSTRVRQPPGGASSGLW